jgi:hypothetical protein
VSSITNGHTFRATVEHERGGTPVITGVGPQLCGQQPSALVAVVSRASTTLAARRLSAARCGATSPRRTPSR